VTFDSEILDLEGEYDPATSTFTSTTGGVYEVATTVTGTTDGTAQTVTLTISTDSTDFTSVHSLDVAAGATTFSIDHNAIIELDPGQTVQIVINIPGGGTVTGGSAITHFEAARFPS
jgi:hypothetical protein